MVRLATWTVALALALTPAGALACAPPMIFFTAGSVRLGTHDLETISDVAKQYRGRPGTRLILFAQGDSTRAAQGNIRLAQRRGDAVRSALARRGVPGRDIVIRTQSEGRAVVFEFERARATCG